MAGAGMLQKYYKKRRDGIGINVLDIFPIRRKGRNNKELNMLYSGN